jgi:hypothetical protein
MSMRLTQLRRSIPEKAQACFEFVQSIRFRWPAFSEAATAPQVLRRGFGDSFTKGTLLIALLRACGIPARLRVATVPNTLFEGLLKTNYRRVPHAYVEAFINKWQGVDAHVFDADLALAANLRLHAERRLVGYGLHAMGERMWQGSDHAFSQLVRGDTAGTSDEWGPFHDGAQALIILRHVGTVYDTSLRSGVSRVIANRRAAHLRRTAAHFHYL